MEYTLALFPWSFKAALNALQANAMPSVALSLPAALQALKRIVMRARERAHSNEATRTHLGGGTLGITPLLRTYSPPGGIFLKIRVDHYILDTLSSWALSVAARTLLTDRRGRE